MKKAKGIGDLTNSRTQILDFQSCSYRWDLSYRRGIQRLTIKESMELGSAVHKAMEYAVVDYARTGKVKGQASAIIAGIQEWKRGERKARGKQLTDEMKIQLEVLAEESVTIARRALAHFDLTRWEVARWRGEPLVEREIVHELPPWAGYRTKPDLVAREKGTKGGWWLIDWKTRGGFEDDDAEEVNLQFATMQYVLEAKAPELAIEGSILWQVRSEAPKWPKRNKDGSMSRALLATDWDTYRKALLDAKLDPADYEDEMVPKLAAIEWYRTIIQHRSSRECEAIWRQIVVPVAAQMANDPPVVRRWVHQPFACKGCWARAFCLAELRGDDTDFLLATDYVSKDRPRPRMEMGDRMTFEMA